MRIETTRFGHIDINEADIITMPQGLYGFETQQRYCLLQHALGSLYRWLQSVTEPSLAFIVIDPFVYFHDYEIDISDADAIFLELNDPSDVKVLALVTFGERDVTANLLGPVVLNRARRVARQIVASDQRYGVRHSLLDHSVRTMDVLCEVA